MDLVHPTASGVWQLTCESQTWENRDVAKTKKTEVLIDRRIPKDRRKSGDRRKESVPVAVERRKAERRKVPRRRQIDPTTCERDYSTDEIEFMQALDAYKRANGRMFPTCSEILEVIRDMGYVRVPAAGPTLARDRPSRSDDLEFDQLGQRSSPAAQRSPSACRTGDCKSDLVSFGPIAVLSLLSRPDGRLHVDSCRLLNEVARWTDILAARES